MAAAAVLAANGFSSAIYQPILNEILNTTTK